MDMNKTLVASAIGMALLGADVANAAQVAGILGNGTWSTNHANFTMLGIAGGNVRGTNDVNMAWDGNAYTASSDYVGPGSASNVTMTSTTPFFGYLWSAHDIQVFQPGSYSFDTTLGGGNAEAGMLNVTVGAGQLGMHMLFDWSGSLNMDVFVVLAQNSVFGSGMVQSMDPANCDNLSAATSPIANCLWDGAGIVPGFKPTYNQLWMLATADGNGDGIMGIPMVSGGPFAGFNATFNANLEFTPTVPVPAAAWLFGSGLAGLLGVARRRKSVLARKLHS